MLCVWLEFSLVGTIDEPDSLCSILDSFRSISDSFCSSAYRGYESIFTKPFQQLLVFHFPEEINHRKHISTQGENSMGANTRQI